MITPEPMAEERMSRALGRIEEAIARIEAAASRGSSQPSAEIESLREAHQALRGRVLGAIAQIDSLLQTEGTR
jgi:hypothetical protein